MWGTEMLKLGMNREFAGWNSANASRREYNNNQNDSQRNTNRNDEPSNDDDQPLDKT